MESNGPPTVRRNSIERVASAAFQLIQARSASEWILRNVLGSTRWRFVLLMVRIAARRAKFKSPFAASGDL